MTIEEDSGDDRLQDDMGARMMISGARTAGAASAVSERGMDAAASAAASAWLSNAAWDQDMPTPERFDIEAEAWDRPRSCGAARDL
jgi:hypothetical protein